jgi:hypothetical protein
LFLHAADVQLAVCEIISVVSRDFNLPDVISDAFPENEHAGVCCYIKVHITLSSLKEMGRVYSVISRRTGSASLHFPQSLRFYDLAPRFQRELEVILSLSAHVCHWFIRKFT